MQTWHKYLKICSHARNSICRSRLPNVRARTGQTHKQTDKRYRTHYQSHLRMTITDLGCTGVSGACRENFYFSRLFVFIHFAKIEYLKVKVNIKWIFLVPKVIDAGRYLLQLFCKPNSSSVCRTSVWSRNIMLANTETFINSYRSKISRYFEWQ